MGGQDKEEIEKYELFSGGGKARSEFIGYIYHLSVAERDCAQEPVPGCLEIQQDRELG